MCYGLLKQSRTKKKTTFKLNATLFFVLTSSHVLQCILSSNTHIFYIYIMHIYTMHFQCAVKLMF